MILRPYQEDAARSVTDGWASGHRARIVVAPTGAGKTVIMAEILKEVISGGGRALVLAHRNELITQGAATFRGFGFRVGIEKGKDKSSALDRVVMSSMQTMAGKRRLKFDKHSFTHVLIDEAHHVLAPSYQETLEYFSLSKVCGVTATPAMGTIDYFDGDFSIDRSTLEAEGFLAKPLIRKISLAVDLKGAKLSADKTRIADSEAGERIDPHLRELVRLLPDVVGDAPGVIFLPLVATSERFRDIAAEHGIKVEHVDGSTSRENREAAYERVRSGQSQILSNANLLTEGFDLPALRWVCVLRPVLSPVYYEQAVGRAARIAPGKTNFLVLDPLFLSERHILGGLDLMGIDPELADEMQMEDKTYDADMIAELAALSEEDLRIKREENRLARERKIAEELQHRGRVARKVGSLQQAAKLRDSDTGQRPTKQQYAMLKRMKLKWAGDVCGWDDIISRSQASRILSACMQRSKAGLASPASLASLLVQIRKGLEVGTLDRGDCIARWSGVREMTQRDVSQWVQEIKSLPVHDKMEN